MKKRLVFEYDDAKERPGVSSIEFIQVACPYTFQKHKNGIIIEGRIEDAEPEKPESPFDYNKLVEEARQKHKEMLNDLEKCRLWLMTRPPSGGKTMGLGDLIEPELLPCPFCGGEAVYRWSSVRDREEVGCMGCGVFVPDDAAWNRRAS